LQADSAARGVAIVLFCLVLCRDRRRPECLATAGPVFGRVY